jgi:iron(III) transport system substrate-binding protein
MILAVVTSALVAAGCGSDDADDAANGDDTSAEDVTLVVYSGREQELVEPLYEQFTEETGIELDVRFGESAALAAQLLEEGDNSPADVFYAQDAGAIGSVADQLAELPEDLVADVPAEFRDPDGRWTGVTGRVRTLVHNTEELSEADLPASVLDLTDPEWKGKLGVAPTNASFIAFVTAMRQQLGDGETKAFLEGLVANDVQTFEKNGAIVDAVASGEIQAGLVNHYYLYEKLGKEPDAPIANHFFEAGDIGNMVNTSAIGILDGAEHADAAQQLVEFMLGDGQRFIVEEAEEREYPLTTTEDLESNERYQELPTLESIEAPEVDLGALGDELEATVRLIEESGLNA